MEQHRAIWAAIQRRDADGAAKAMEDHLITVLSRYEEDDTLQAAPEPQIAARG